MNSRAKGAVGERELAQYFREHGYEAKRGQQHSGGSDSPDVVGGPSGFHWECKRVESDFDPAWYAQACRDAARGASGGSPPVPVVAYRRNRRKWRIAIAVGDLFSFLTELDLSGTYLVHMLLDDFMALIKDVDHAK